MFMAVIYQFTSEEIELLKKVNQYVFQINAEQSICFECLSFQVNLFLKGLNTQSSEFYVTPNEWSSKIKSIESSKSKLHLTPKERREDVLTAIDALRSELYKLHICENRYRVVNSPSKGCFDSSDLSITLYLDNISKTHRKEDVVYIYIHNMFHAYYYIRRGGRDNYVKEIEECMVEFSTLAFLNQMAKDDIRFYPVCEHAKREIQSKRYTIGDVAAYGFGKYVFDHCSDKGKWIEAYLKKSHLLNSNISNVKEFVDNVCRYYPIDECKCYNLLEQILFSEYFSFELVEQVSVSKLDYDNIASESDSSNEPKIKFKLMDDFHDVVLRILLIDDKIGCKIEDNNELKEKLGTRVDVWQCPSKKDCSQQKCKLCTIKRLMDDGEMNDGKAKIYGDIGSATDYFYWKEQKIECYYCPTITGDFIDKEQVINSVDGIFVHPTEEDKKNRKQGKYIDYTGVFSPKIENENLHVQIVGVRDVRTALLLMSKFKFDMVFCDYLLDYKEGDSGSRDYATQLFEFLSHNYKKDIEKEKKQKPQDEAKIKRLEVLEQLRHDVLDNRGPLGKFWIMPITGFNQTFIQDLHRSQINLIDYRWNINNGADPITTPWQFLYHLNKFIELQLRSCVYTMEQLLTFLLYTCQDLNTIEETVKVKDKEEKKVDFDDFQSFMGSEYTTLIQLYGNKYPIKRDAVIEDDDKNAQYKSVFTTYVWNNFYANKERKFVNEIELYRLMHRFYHRATVMYNDQRGKKLLNDAFASLQFFLYSNSRVRDTIVGNDALKELYESGKGLNKLKEVVEKCTSDQNNGKDKE